MKNPRLSKLQHLLVTQLLKEGTVELRLPCGMTLEIGITQQDESGETVKADDYCYVIANHNDRSVLLDSYNLGMQYGTKQDTIVFEDDIFDEKGRSVKRLDVV